jgi:uncharacterized protein DUF4328
VHPGPVPQRPPRVDWVATPPPSVLRRRPVAPRRARYNGPPSYATPPRWGFPALIWRWQTSVPGGPGAGPSLVERLRVTARPAQFILWLLAGVAALAGAAETWRYVLLVLSRDGALKPGTVRTSDTLVLGASLLAMIVAVVAAVLTLWWLYVARGAATEHAGHKPGRPDWQVLLWLVIPGLNLVVAGSMLAELEHAVLGRDAHQRPRPGRLVLVWWAAWVLSGVLFAVTVLWTFRDGVQAMADGVVLHAVTDLAAAAVAALTAVVIRRMTVLLAPADLDKVRRLRVIKVVGAPELERAPRPATARR